MKSASVAAIESRFREFLKDSEGGPVVVTRNGKPVAVIVGIHEKDQLERLLMAFSPRLQAIVEESRKQIRDGEVLSHEEFWAEIETFRVTGKQGRKGTKGKRVPARNKSS